MQPRIITNELIENFRLYLYEEEQSTNTIEKYLLDNRMFWQCVGKRELQKSDVRY